MLRKDVGEISSVAVNEVKRCSDELNAFEQQLELLDTVAKLRR